MSIFGTVPNDEFVVYGKIKIEPSRVDEAIELLKAVTKVAQESPGILYFCIAQDDTDPTIFYGHERYTGRQAFEKHQGNETVTKFFKSGLVLDAKPKVLKQIQ